MDLFGQSFIIFVIIRNLSHICAHFCVDYVHCNKTGFIPNRFHAKLFIYQIVPIISRRRLTGKIIIDYSNMLFPKK